MKLIKLNKTKGTKKTLANTVVAMNFWKYLETVSLRNSYNNDKRQMTIFQSRIDSTYVGWKCFNCFYNVWKYFFKQIKTNPENWISFEKLCFLTKKTNVLHEKWQLVNIFFLFFENIIFNFFSFVLTLVSAWHLGRKYLWLSFGKGTRKVWG